MVVDDASSDDTRLIVEERAQRDSRIRLVAHAERRGSTAAWNTVFAECTGALCIKLDGDVRIPQPDFVRRIERALELGGAELAYCSVVPRERPASFVQRGSSFIYDYLAEQNRIGRATAATLFAGMLAATRRFYATYRIDESIVANDYYTARYARAHGVGVTVAADAVVTARPARTLADFRKQARRAASAHAQIDALFGDEQRSIEPAVPAILNRATRDPLGFVSFLLLRGEMKAGETSPAWEQAASTK